MNVRKLHRGIVLLFGLLALLVGGIQQNDLSRNVLEAALTDSGAHGAGHAHAHAMGGHIMPDGTFMAGDMPGMAHGPAQNADHSGGHTHKGHADCALCGPLAAMAAFTQPAYIFVKTPDTFAAPVFITAERRIVVVLPRAPYACRAPPAEGTLAA